VGILRSVRQQQLLQRGVRGLWAWAAAGAFRQRTLAAKAVAALQAAAVRARENAAKAAAARSVAVQRRVMVAWHKAAAEQV